MRHEVMARAESPRGEVVVRRRVDAGDPGDPGDPGSPDGHGSPGGAVLELRVNGVFVMDTAETGTERVLAQAALAQVRRPHRVLVGGLGLGYTLRALLADPRVQHVVVAEIEPAVVTWTRDGVLPGADALADPRVEVVVDDVRRLVHGLMSDRTSAGTTDGSSAGTTDGPSDCAATSFDVVLLDVDNGPDFLVHDANADVYGTAFLADCRRLLRPGGALSVWSSTRADALVTALRDVYGDCDAHPLPVRLQDRDEYYWLFTAKMTV